MVAIPKVSPPLARDFLKLKKLTPSNAWIWTWWDNGYPIAYYSQRAVFHNGGGSGSPKTYFIATTFSTPDSRQGYNTILSMANPRWWEDIANIRKNKKSTDIFKGIYARQVVNPIYIAYTEDLVSKFMWINYFGTWDLKTKRGIKKPIIQLKGCANLGGFFRCGNMVLNPFTGTILIKNMERVEEVLLKTVVVKENGIVREYPKHDHGMYLEIIKEAKGTYFYLLDSQPYHSLFNQMYILRNYDAKLFELIYDDYPTMVLYKVVGTGIAPN